MAGCLNYFDEDNVSPDSVDRWSENVSNVLKSPTAINKFHEYLNDEGLGELSLLQFWQKCQELIDYYNKHKPYKYEQLKILERKKRLHSRREEWENVILNKSKEYLEFAIEYVNFDAELLVLDSAIQTEDILQTIAAFKEVKDTTEDLLQRDGYPQFRAHVLKKYGFVNNKTKEDIK